MIGLVLLLVFATTTAVSVSAAPTPPTVCYSGTPPVVLGEPLRFCGNTGISCCDGVDDDALREELGAMHVPDATCAAIVKSVLCARCIPFVWSSAATNLSATNLCASSSVQAQQQPFVSAGTASRPTPEQDTTSMCLERISATTFHVMAAHPDGSGRVFLSSRQDGKVWLATMPRRGGGATLQINDAFLDLMDHGGVRGVVGLAFHPEFTTNGRFFVSYICDSRNVSPPTACGGAGAGDGCRYHLVVGEFSAQGGEVTRADPSEVRRIFTLGLPQPQHKLFSYQRHGGQILFRPTTDGDSDGYLYLITGYGYSSSKQSGSTSFLGKILRFSVGIGNGSAGGSEWPDTEMHTDDKPEMFAAGLNNPSACSFDSDRPSQLLCADVSEQRSERVYLIKAAKQRGGTRSSSSSSSGATVSIVVNRGRPADGRMPSIVGGLVYRGSAEPSLKGRYLYVYASRVWSGRYTSTTQVANVSCSWKSPVPCRSSNDENGGIIGGRVLSMAEDNRKDAFFLTTAGVFRVVQSGACGALPQPQWPPGIGWLLSVGSTALALALYVCCAIQTGGGQIQIGRCRNCCFIDSIFCCSRRCPHRSRGSQHDP